MEDIDNGFKEIKKQLEILGKLKLIIHIDPNATYEDGTKVDFVAMLMEYGSDEFKVHYPARPFFRSTLDANYDKILRFYEKNLDKVIAGEMKARESFSKLGAYVVKKMREMIMNGEFAELSEKTIALKGSSKPLIDTKLLYRSVKYKIEEI